LRSAAALLALMVLAGCGGKQRPRPAPAPSATATPRAPSERELIGDLLERRARRTADRVARLGVRRAHYDVVRIALHGRRARIRARFSYRVRGVLGDFGTPRTLVARKRHGRWRIARVVGERDAEPWQVDDYVRTVLPHFVVLHPRDLAAPADALEDGYARLEETLRRSRLRRRYLVVVARDGEDAHRLTRRIAGVASLTALTDTLLGAGTRIAAQRLLIVQSNFGLTSAEDQQSVVTHELTHAVLAPFATGRTPAWLIEGVALYVSADDRRAEYAALPVVPTLAAMSTPEAIARLSGEEQRAAYAASSAAAHLIAERFGRDALLRLYRAFSRPGPRRGSAAYSDRVVRRTLGVGLDELQRTLG
jgi:hypothetical protein